MEEGQTLLELQYFLLFQEFQWRSKRKLFGCHLSYESEIKKRGSMKKVIEQAYRLKSFTKDLKLN